MQPDEKDCPSCAEIVRIKATRCRFCGHDFTGQSPPASGPASPKIVNAGPQKNSFQSCMGCFGFVILALIAITAIGNQMEKNEAANSSPITEDGGAR